MGEHGREHTRLPAQRPKLPGQLIQRSDRVLSQRKGKKALTRRVRHPQVQHLAASHHLGQILHQLRDGRRVIPPVYVQNINERLVWSAGVDRRGIGQDTHRSELLERSLERVFQRLLGVPDVVDSDTVLGPLLGVSIREEGGELA